MSYWRPAGWNRDPFASAHPTMTRPDAHAYFMGIALAVRARADCTGNRVGAVQVDRAECFR
jgi:deoxycytidylate deaminase